MNKTTHIRVYRSTHKRVKLLAEMLDDSVPGLIARIIDELWLEVKGKPKGEFILTELFGRKKER